MTFDGPEGVKLYVAITVRAGLRLYARTGIQPNRQWTPTAMMRKAGELTGKPLKRRDYAGAIRALDEYIGGND